MRQNPNSASQRLSSWKEIAEYLRRGVRTVQRWERALQLPVRRIGSGRRSPVYAVASELDLWILSVGKTPVHPAQRTPGENSRTEKQIAESHRLMSNMAVLAHAMAEASVRQRRQAEILEKRIIEIRARVRA